MAFIGVETSTEISNDITVEVAQNVAVEASNDVARGAVNKIVVEFANVTSRVVD